MTPTLKALVEAMRDAWRDFWRDPEPDPPLDHWLCREARDELRVALVFRDFGDKEMWRPALRRALDLEGAYRIERGMPWPGDVP